MAKTTHYLCPACGGTLEFDSKTQKMKCPFCDTEVDIADLEDKHSSTKDATSYTEEDSQDNLAYYICESCGGQIAVPKETGATSCPFCGNSQVLPAQFEGDLKPDAIIPFKLDKKDCKAQYLKHLEGKHFLPKIFRSTNHIDELKGVYVPFWLYNSKLYADLAFDCERIEEKEDSRYKYITHYYYDVYRKGTLKFKDVPADAASAIADDLMDSIEPYDLAESSDYNDAYLSGFYASRYDITDKEAFPRVETRMHNSIVDEMENSIKGFDNITLRGSAFDFKKVEARHVLFPVYLLNTTWQNQRFTFAMNGQTGKFVGNLPRDDRAYYRTLVLYSLGLSFVYFFLICVFYFSE